MQPGCWCTAASISGLLPDMMSACVGTMPCLLLVVRVRNFCSCWCSNGCQIADGLTSWWLLRPGETCMLVVEPVLCSGLQRSQRHSSPTGLFSWSVDDASVFSYSSSSQVIQHSFGRSPELCHWLVHVSCECSSSTSQSLVSPNATHRLCPWLQVSQSVLINQISSHALSLASICFIRTWWQ